MEIKRSGVTRIVFVFKKFVIKMPNFTCQHNHFLNGCLANYNERFYYKSWKKIDWHWKDKVAPTYFCTWFGLIQIQAKADILVRDLSDDEELKFKELTTDLKGNNFGFFKNELVCVDFA